MFEGRCPIQCLGVTIGMKRLPLSAFNPLLERIRLKLAAWKAKALSFAGKSMLVNSVFQSIPFYLMSSSWVYLILCWRRWMPVVEGFSGVKMARHEVCHLWLGMLFVGAEQMGAWVSGRCNHFRKL